MLITINIEDDILTIVKKSARKKQVAQGKILSDLARETIIRRRLLEDKEEAGNTGVGGFRPFPSRGVIITNKQVNRLRDQEGI
jgi:hypothetical protein